LELLHARKNANPKFQSLARAVVKIEEASARTVTTAAETDLNARPQNQAAPQNRAAVDGTLAVAEIYND
jgi:IS5 family transposase